MGSKASCNGEGLLCVLQFLWRAGGSECRSSGHGSLGASVGRSPDFWNARVCRLSRTNQMMLEPVDQTWKTGVALGIVGCGSSHFGRCCPELFPHLPFVVFLVFSARDLRSWLVGARKWPSRSGWTFGSHFGGTPSRSGWTATTLRIKASFSHQVNTLLAPLSPTLFWERLSLAHFWALTSTTVRAARLLWLVVPASYPIWDLCPQALDHVANWGLENKPMLRSGE